MLLVGISLPVLCLLTLPKTELLEGLAGASQSLAGRSGHSTSFFAEWLALGKYLFCAQLLYIFNIFGHLTKNIIQSNEIGDLTGFIKQFMIGQRPI